MTQIAQYIAFYQQPLTEIKEEDLIEIVKVIVSSKRVFCIGNGGSASTANHLASDLQAIGVQATSLCANEAILTRLGNDKGCHYIFREQLIENKIGKGDCVIAISCSGNSPNILAAIESANQKGVTSIGLIGFGGGKLKELTSHSLILSSKDYGVVEGVHSCLCHIIPQIIKEKAWI